jgi:hypothetical protein
VTVKGTAKITGGGICKTKAFRINVSGKRISKVVFSVDKKKALTLTSPNHGKSSYSLKITPSKLARGAHRASAVVSFRAATKKKPQTFTRVFAVGTLLNGTPCRGIIPERPSG